MYRTNRIAAALAALLVAGLVLAGCGGDDDAASPATTATTATTAEPATTAETAPPTTAAPELTEIAITVRGGQPVGGIERPKVSQGERVAFLITADARDEAHLHGYDLEATIGPGQTGRIELTASIPGRFELELHESGRQIADLTVEP